MTEPAWPTVKLGELADNLDRLRVPVSAPERAKRAGTVPYYGASGQVDVIDVPLFNEDLVLIGEDGVQFFDPTKRKAYRISGPSWVNNHAHVLRPRRDRVDDGFLTHYLNSFDYHGYANGTTRLKLTQAAMNAIPVPLPPLAEQRRIVAILEDHLSRLDAGLASCESAHSLVGPLHDSTDTVVLRECAKETAIGDVAVDVRYGSSVKCSELGQGPLVLRIPNVSNGHVTPTPAKFARSADQIPSVLMVEPGDLLVIRSNGSPALVGRTAVVPAGMQAAFASYLIRIRLDTSKARPDWVGWMLSTRSGRRRIESFTRSSAGQHNINGTSLKRIKIPLPPLESQAQLLEQRDALRGSAEVAAAEMESIEQRATTLRRSLLAAAFSGRL